MEIFGSQAAGFVRVKCHMTTTDEARCDSAVYWHRALPPLDAEPAGEYTLEATSSRVPGTLSHRDDLWNRCYKELMLNTERRLVQEIARLAGDYAHVHDECIQPRRDHVAGEAWLHGRFRYVLYRTTLGTATAAGRDAVADRSGVTFRGAG